MTHTETATMQLSEGAAKVCSCAHGSSRGAFTLDDEGILVTLDLDEEWAECMARHVGQTIRRVCTTTCPASGDDRCAGWVSVLAEASAQAFWE